MRTFGRCAEGITQPKLVPSLVEQLRTGAAVPSELGHSPHTQTSLSLQITLCKRRMKCSDFVRKSARKFWSVSVIPLLTLSHDQRSRRAVFCKLEDGGAFHGVA